MPIIRFDAADLANTRFAISPLGHLVHGVQGSACSVRSGLRQQWWRTARRNVPGTSARLVAMLAADPERTPSSLLPPAVDGVLEPTLDQELERLEAAGPHDVPGLVDSVRALFRACMADDWADIRRTLRADLGHRTETMLTGGPVAVLRTLHPELTWQDGHLVAGTTAPGLERHPDGAGFRLMPCAFGRDGLHPVIDAAHQPILIYSALPEAGPAGAGGLEALLGTGRARTLRALDGSPASTTELARRLGVSAPTASVHAARLRDAGLTTSMRDGRNVLHCVTPLGAGLLAANPGTDRERAVSVPR
ncbi:ArsR/SmtB family transcription factor [Actinomadura rupiterrae]|uniref:ArsR/SmtB family transcription factor n=1 Tax=Actinomadura rupiterrae TaxID=559627 RepID=UPI0020A50A18|nr:winged helix-turn-helix domain-containing protein [Actinomadura rupiterrae]MCP2336864.1 DNA-binding transcriptional ArsR family regulator [Actinomadura rupiterrae]